MSEAAGRFRIALEQSGLRLVTLADFPHGSCGDACELLGQYLSESGLGEWTYRSGQRDDPFVSHAWLEREGLILDITADQFPERTDPVVLTADRTWHDTFQSIAGRHIANLDWFADQDGAGDALADYGVLKERSDATRRQD